VQDGGYGTALQAASEAGHKTIVQLLVERGEDVNAQNRKYGNALQAVSKPGHNKIVKQLLDTGAQDLK
jgi:ankyrin repeat protein